MRKIDYYTERMTMPRNTQLARLLFAFSCLIVGLLMSTSGYAQKPEECGSVNCTSNDVRIIGAKIADINGNFFTCSGSEPVSGAYLHLTVTTRTPRKGVYISAQLKVQGQPAYHVSNCFSDDLTGDNNVLKVALPTGVFNCGSEATLEEIFTAWGTGNTDFCVGSAAVRCPDTKSKCRFVEGEVILVQTTPCAQPNITQQPVGATKCAGSSASFSVDYVSSTSSFITTTVQWQELTTAIGAVWTNIPGQTNKTLNLSNVTVAMNGYKYRAVVTNTTNDTNIPVGERNCPRTSAEVILTVNAIPTAPVLSVVNNCNGTSMVTAKAGETNISPNELTWSDGGSGNPRTVSATTALTVTRTISSCTSAVSNTVTPAPKTSPAAPTNPNHQTVCQTNQSQTLTATATVPAGSSIVWYTHPEGGSVVTNPTLSAVGSVTYYAETVKEDCSSASRTPVTLTYNGAPAVPTSGGTKSVCAQSPVQTLTATATPPDGASVVWYDAPANGNVVSIPTLGAVGSVTYYAASKNNVTNCQSLTRTAVTLTIKATPVAPAVSATSQPTCAVGAGTITVSSPNANYSYTLTGTSPVREPVTRADGIFSNVSPGAYTVTATLEGCTSAPSSPVTISAAQAAPTIPIVTVKTAASCSSSRVVLEVTGPTPLSDYEFRNRDGEWGSSNEFTIKAGEGYSITAKRKSDPSCVSAAATCEAEQEVSTGDLTTTSTSTLQNLEKTVKDELRAYPVPFSDKTTIEFRAAQDGEYVINLYDMKGTLVRQLKAGVARVGEMTQVEVDGQRMAEGMYLARMVSGSGAKTVKLLKKN